ncbi:MAG TPA: ABC transporter permease [Puia sp.]|nr:ABC transporter permease [Puia sp.]
MIQHYLKVALRNIFRHKFFSFINILSLSVGLSCFFLFLLYFLNETTYDRFNKNADTIFRVYEWSKGQNGGAYSGDAWLYLPLGPALKKDFPDLKNFVRLMSGGNPCYIKYEDKQIKLPVTFADSSFFEFFPAAMLYGNSLTTLGDNNNVVVTRKVSRILFGSEDPIGRIISIKIRDHFDNFKVSGVTEDLPSNSSISFDLLLNLAYFESSAEGKFASTSWNYSGFQNFIWLNHNSDLTHQPERFVALRKKYFPDEQAQQIKDGIWDGKGLPPVTFRLQPLTDIHTNFQVTAGSANHPIDMNAIWVLFGIATGILVIGCVNFTTLAIARSSKRSKEIGVRKVIGGQKRQIMIQFLAESFLLSCIAGAIALFLAWLFIPVFDTMVNAEIHFSLFHYAALTWMFAIAVVVAGLLSGIYPAGVLANLKIVSVLKNRVRINGSNIFTKGLITGQYILSIGLVITTIVISQQLDYMRTMDIGFNKDNVVVIKAGETDGNKVFPLFTTALKNDDEILGITSSDGSFGDMCNTSGFNYNGKIHPAINFSVATNFLSVMGMHLMTGRMLDSHVPTDTINSVIVNEALVRDLGLTNKSILGLRLQNYSARLAEDPIELAWSKTTICCL